MSATRTRCIVWGSVLALVGATWWVTWTPERPGADDISALVLRKVLGDRPDLREKQREILVELPGGDPPADFCAALDVRPLSEARLGVRQVYVRVEEPRWRRLDEAVVDVSIHYGSCHGEGVVLVVCWRRGRWVARPFGSED